MHAQHLLAQAAQGWLIGSVAGQTSGAQCRRTSCLASPVVIIRSAMTLAALLPRRCTPRPCATAQEQAGAGAPCAANSACACSDATHREPSAREVAHSVLTLNEVVSENSQPPARSWSQRIVVWSGCRLFTPIGAAAACSADSYHAMCPSRTTKKRRSFRLKIPDFLSK